MGEITSFIELYIEDSDILPKKTYEIARALQNNTKEKKALHWGGKGGPFSKGHMHPGTKPNDFLGRGLAQTIARYG